MKSKVLNLVLTNDLKELETLRLELERFGCAHCLSKRQISQVNLVLDELFSNIVSYAYPDKASHRVKISVLCDTQQLTLVIKDDGVPFNPLECDPPDTGKLEERRVGGMGIHLVRHLVDEIRYCRKAQKNILTLRKYISPRNKQERSHGNSKKSRK